MSKDGNERLNLHENDVLKSFFFVLKELFEFNLVMEWIWLGSEKPTKCLIFLKMGHEKILYLVKSKILT